MNSLSKGIQASRILQKPQKKTTGLCAAVSCFHIANFEQLAASAGGQFYSSSLSFIFIACKWAFERPAQKTLHTDAAPLQVSRGDGLVLFLPSAFVFSWRCPDSEMLLARISRGAPSTFCIASPDYFTICAQGLESSTLHQHYMEEIVPSSDLSV